MTTARYEQCAVTPTTTPLQPKATQPASPSLPLAALPPTAPPCRQSSPSLFKQPSLPSSRSFPSLLSLASSSASSSSAASLVPAASPSSHLRRVNSDLCRQGNAAFSQRQFDVAIQHYTAALELSFDDPRTWNNRATAYVAKRLYRMGIRDYHEAIARAPHCGDFYYKRGVAWSALKQYAYAIEDYSRCIELKGDEPDALNNRGNAYRILGQHKLARADLAKAVQLVPASSLYQSNLRRVEAALAEEDKTGSSAQQRAIQAIVQSVLQTRLQGAGAPEAVLPGVSGDVERMLRQLIISRQAAPPVSPSPSPSHASAFTPVSPSSASPSSPLPSAVSLSSIIDSLPAPVMNHLLQYFHHLSPKQPSPAHHAASSPSHRRSGSKRSRSLVRTASSERLSSDEEECECEGKRARVAVRGDELYDDDRSVDDSDSCSGSDGSSSDGSRSPASDGRLDVAEMDSCKRPIAV